MLRTCMQVPRFPTVKQVDLLVLVKDWIMGFEPIRRCCRNRFAFTDWGHWPLIATLHDCALYRSTYPYKKI